MTQRAFWIGLAVAFVIVFGPVLRHDFILLDDDQHLFNNPSMLRPSIESTVEYWKKPYFGLYIPVTYTLWAVEAGFAKPTEPQSSVALHAWVFHLGNILFHALNAALVARIVFLLFASSWAAGFAAAFFALHPIQVETVSWAAGRRDLLAMFFGLLALWQLLKGCRPNFRWAKHFGIATFFYMLALLSKPSSASLALMAPLLLWGWDRKKVRELALAFAGWVLLAVPIFWITRSQQPETMLNFIPAWHQRPLVVLDSVWFYIRQIAAPVTLAIDYARDPRWVLENKAWMAGAIGIALIIVAAVVMKAGKKGCSAALIFLVAIAPVSGALSFAFQQYTTVADHYAYTAMFALALAVAMVATRFQTEQARTAITAAIALFAARSVAYVPQWSDSATMFVHTISHYPRSQIANNNLGYIREKQGNLQEALTHYKAALELRPNWADASYNVGNIHAKMGKFGEAENYLQQAIKQNPRHSDAHHVLGSLYMNTGHLPEALRELKRAIELKPDNASYHSKYGSALTYMKQYDKALESYQTALRLNPMLAEAYNNQGVALQRMGRKAEAMDSFANAIGLNEQYVPAKVNLASLLSSEKRCSEALPLFAAIAQQAGENNDLRMHVARCLAQVGRGAEALQIYEKLAANKTQDPEMKKNLSQLRREIATESKKGPANAQR